MVGHAFEARIYAENPRNNFLPDSGTLHYLSTPTPTHVFAPSFSAREKSASSGFSPMSGVSEASSLALDITPSLRIEQGFNQGASIGVFYDPMIAKVVAHGRDRTEALRVLRKALDEYHVVGPSTNVEFLRTLAGNKSFIDEEVETGFIKVWTFLYPDTASNRMPPCRNTLMSYSHRSSHLSQKYLRKRPCLSSCAIQSSKVKGYLVPGRR